MPEIDPWLLAYLTAVAVWSFSMAFYVGPWAIRKRTDDPNGRLTLSLVGLFRRTFREEVKSDEFKGALKEAMPAFQLPDTAALGAKLEAITAWANSVTPLVNNLSEENLLPIIEKAGMRRKMADVRAGKGDAQEEDLVRAQHAMENPDGAALLANAKRAIDGLVNNKIIKAGTGKNWKDQIDDQFTSTGDITDLIKSFGFSLERLGGAGGGMAAGPDGSAGWKKDF